MHCSLTFDPLCGVLQRHGRARQQPLGPPPRQQALEVLKLFNGRHQPARHHFPLVLLLALLLLLSWQAKNG